MDDEKEGLVAEEAPVPEDVPETDDRPAPEPAHVPMSVMLGERDRRQALERELAEIRAAPSPEPGEALELELYRQRLDLSREAAEKTHGAELTQTVHDWAARRCDEDPRFNAEMKSARFPYEAALAAYNREQIAAKVSPERLAAFEAWEAAQAEAQTLQSPAPAGAPPRSLATAPGNGGAGAPPITVAEGEAFRSAIPR